MKDQDKTAPPTDSAPAAPPVEDKETGVTETADAAPAPSAAPASRRGWLGGLALLIALAAAGASGYLWLQQREQAELMDELGRMRVDLDARTRELQRLRGELDILTGSAESQGDGLADLGERLDRQARQLDELPPRLGRLERALENVPGVADRARSAWLLAESEYYLRIANAQLNLAGNVDVALRALELADEKLRDLGDPGLTRVRSQLADEITALKGVPRPDAEGIVLTLGSLARNLEGLPLARQAPGRFGSPEAPDPDRSGLARAWDAIVNALKSVISVKRSDATVTPLRSPAEESMLIRILDMELQIARLSLIRGESALYRQSLESATGRLTRYFDMDAAQVRATLTRLEELTVADLPEALPDISGSLALLLSLTSGAAVP